MERKKLPCKQDRPREEGHPMDFDEAWSIIKNDHRKIFPPLILKDTGEAYSLIFEDESDDDKEGRQMKMALDSFCCTAYVKVCQGKNFRYMSTLGLMVGNSVTVEEQELSFTFIRVGYLKDTSTTKYFYTQMRKQ